MTAPGNYAAGDNSFARSAGGAAGRGVVLIIIAVVIGAFLLSRGFDGSGAAVANSPEPAPAPDVEPATDEPGEEPAPADDCDPDVEECDPVTPVEEEPAGTPLATHPPAEVRVAAVNGVGTSGLAGTASEILSVNGFVTGAKNSAAPIEASAIYYRAGFSEDAKAIASVLGAPADVIAPAPDNVLTLISNPEDVADFDVYVVLGTDAAITI